MKKTIMYLLALMVTFSLVPSCNDEEEPAPWEVEDTDDGGVKLPMEPLTAPSRVTLPSKSSS